MTDDTSTETEELLCLVCLAFRARTPAAMRCRGCGGLYCDECGTVHPGAWYPTEKPCPEGMERLQGGTT
jgi:hypothetical protein